jgi:hypothetical protein
MSISLYQASVPVFIRGLESLSRIIEKGAMHAVARKIDPDTFLQSRLYPDMFPLLRQVQIVSDTSKGAGARLAGLEVPNMPDTEASFLELQQRIAKTLHFLRSLKPEQIDGQESRRITIPTRTRGELEFNGQSYLLEFALPNFFFHVSTAYGILRHNGVEIGKWDYLGS